jgi:inhibitor of KinA sporulation pathway (predicted exonuclease)
MKNLHFNKIPKPMFLKKIFNIEKILMKVSNSKSHVTSSDLSNIFKYENKKSKKHRAVDDATNIYFSLKKLIDEKKISLSDLFL